jgi:hypothetical protein
MPKLEQLCLYGSIKNLDGQLNASCLANLTHLSLILLRFLSTSVTAAWLQALTFMHRLVKLSITSLLVSLDESCDFDFVFPTLVDITIADRTRHIALFIRKLVAPSLILVDIVAMREDDLDVAPEHTQELVKSACAHPLELANAWRPPTYLSWCSHGVLL